MKERSKSRRKFKMTADSLRVIIDELRSLFEQFQERPPSIWENIRRENILWLRQQASELEKHKKNVNIATVAGTGIGMAGTISGIVIISVALAPVTFGGSLALGLGLGSAAVSLGGAVTAIGAQQVKKRIIHNDSVLEATRRLEQDLLRLTELHEIVQQIQNLVPFSNEHSSPFENLGAEFERAAEAAKDPTEGISSLASKTVTGPWTILRAVAGVGDEVLMDAGKVALTAVRAIGGAAIALGGVSLIVDTVTLVKAAQDIKEGSQCELAKKYREKADQLEEEKERTVTEFRRVEIERYVDDARLAIERALGV